MTEFNQTFPFPPTLNSYWRKSQKGMYVCEKGKQFRREVKKICASSVVLFSSKKRVAMSVKLYPPDKRKRDVDNYAKALLDALSHANVYEDDSQIDLLVLERCESVKGGKCEVTIRVM